MILVRNPWAGWQIRFLLCAWSLVLPLRAMCEELPVKLTHLYPTKKHLSVEYDAKILASPLLESGIAKPLLIVSVTSGTVSFVDTNTGVETAKVELPRESGLRVLIMSTPVQVGRNLVVLYQMLGKSGRESHRIAVVDLDTHQLNSDFEILELKAEKPQADGKAMVRFDPPHAFSHSEVKHARRSGAEYGYIYAAFGNAADVQPFHGWLFEIDMDAWKKRGSTHAINNVLVTTPESECNVKYKYGTREMICAGGIWTPAGPQIVYNGDDYELLVPTGNGQTDLARHDYANTLIRVKAGLEFDSGCNASLCQDFKPTNPSLECIESCKNLFIPRLKKDDKPLKPPSGDCDQLTFWECLARMDYDLGANAPVKINIDSEHAVIVQASKEGAAYLLDASHIGTMLDRIQLIETCGTKTDPCKLDWRGMMLTHPVVSSINNTPLVIFPTYVFDESHAAGLIAVKIVTRQGKIQFEKLWQFPAPDSPIAAKTFRSPPTLPVVSSLSKYGDVIWIVDIGKHGSLYGVRASDGQLLAKTSLVGSGVPLARPVVSGNQLYITSKRSGQKTYLIESIQID